MEYVCSVVCLVAAIARLAATSVNSATALTSFRSPLQAQIARLAGYCYDDFDSLRENVAAEGLRVIASGDTFFTRWYVASGRISGNVPGEDNEATATVRC